MGVSASYERCIKGYSDAFMKKQSTKERNYPPEVRQNMGRMGIYSKPFCKACKKVFSTEWTLASHIDLKHVKSVVYKCPYCDKEYLSKSHRSVHIYRNHREEHAAQRLNWWCLQEECLAAITGKNDCKRSKTTSALMHRLTSLAVASVTRNSLVKIPSRTILKPSIWLLKATLVIFADATSLV